MDKELVAGKIVNTHGIRGEVKVMYYADSPEFFDDIKNIKLMPSEKTFKLEGVRAHKGAVLLKLSGINTLDEAEKLVGNEIYVNRAETHLPEGKYYIVDILGCDVVKEDGELIGEISDVFQTGSNDVFEIDCPDRKKRYIPNIKDVVKIIDINLKKVTIHVIEGLLDDEN